MPAQHTTRAEIEEARKHPLNLHCLKMTESHDPAEVAEILEQNLHETTGSRIDGYNQRGAGNALQYGQVICKPGVERMAAQGRGLEG